jgi:thiol:disulfide interchange protein DsbD
LAELRAEKSDVESIFAAFCYLSRVLAAAVPVASLLLAGVTAPEASAFASAVGRGPLQAAAVALLGGLLVSLTPCVYPMIAITVSVFGARQSKSKLHGLGLSASFVLGIVAMFVPLGVTAGLSGALFGSALQSRWVLTFIATLFAAMAASMFGAFEVALPSALTNRLARVGGIGPRGAFGLGLVCGLIAAPCTGPVLTGILTWIAQSQSAAAGALAMTAFSLGLGFPFLIVGTFAVQLPKSGRWMLHVKSVLAILLAVVALYYLDLAFPALADWVQPNAALYVSCGAVIAGGLLLGAVHRDFGSPFLAEKALKSAGASSVTLACFVLVIALTTPVRAFRWSHAPLLEAQATARAEKRPLLVDFTASWCGACKELDRDTFADPAVSGEAGRFLAVKVDATDDENERTRQTLERHHVRGLPTVLLFDSKGAEIRRFTAFVPPGEFLAALKPIH